MATHTLSKQVHAFASGDRPHARALTATIQTAPACPRPRRTGEAGAAAMMAVFVMATGFGLMATGMVLVLDAKRSVAAQLSFHGQAVNAAEAGLVDALSWFRRQAVQPVATFAPALDLDAEPPINETDDPDIGIVREFEISSVGSIWGRYEVRVEDVVDVSASRGQAGTGRIWQIESRGYIYARLDPDADFDETPNRVMRHAEARTEVQRLSVVLPANAAIVSTRASWVTTEARTRVFGDSNIGLCHPPATGSASVAGLLTGTPAQSSVTPFDSTLPTVFGVSQQELLGMADVRVSSVNDLPVELPAMSLIVITGNATFDGEHPLTGSGILVVLGNLTLAADSNASFNGVIHVAGTYDQHAPSQVSGAIVGRDRIRIHGAGDFSEVTYDGTLLSTLQQTMGQYRFNRSTVYLNARPGQAGRS